MLDLYKGDVDYGYTVEDLETASPTIEQGDIVLIYSGYKDVEKPTDRIKQTYLTVEAAQWLVDRGVKSVGCEPAGIEHLPDGYFVHRWYAKDTPDPPSWPAHRILLGSARLHHGGARRTSSASAGNAYASPPCPLLFPGLTGCPVRAVAWLDR